MRLKHWAVQQGIHYQTAWTGFRAGKLSVPALQTPSGDVGPAGVAAAGSDGRREVG